jgi:dolichyl-phosphate beta-glucosyltransferase
MQKVGLIIPCYNEEKRFLLQSFTEFLQNNRDWLSLLFVNDGSTDNTEAKLECFCSAFENNEASYISFKKNRGKAEAVRVGIRKLIRLNEVEFIGYWDADLSTPLSELFGILNVFASNQNTLVVIGSRVKLCGRTIQRNRYRHYSGRILATVVNVIFYLPTYDTQCGAKLFKKDVLDKTTKQQFQSCWLFDLELLLRIKNLLDEDYDSWLFEYPLQKWIARSGSNISIKSYMLATIDLFRIYFRCNRKLTNFFSKLCNIFGWR